MTRRALLREGRRAAVDHARRTGRLHRPSDGYRLAFTVLSRVGDGSATRLMRHAAKL